MNMSSPFDPLTSRLICGCSAHSPCTTAAPLFRHGRDRRLFTHLVRAYGDTLKGLARAELDALSTDYSAQKNKPPPV